VKIWTKPLNTYVLVYNRLHFILIVTLDILLIISNFLTTCQVTLIRVLVRLWLGRF